MAGKKIEVSSIPVMWFILQSLHGYMEIVLCIIDLSIESWILISKLVISLKAVLWTQRNSCMQAIRRVSFPAKVTCSGGFACVPLYAIITHFLQTWTVNWGVQFIFLVFYRSKACRLLIMAVNGNSPMISNSSPVSNGSEPSQLPPYPPPLHTGHILQPLSVFTGITFIAPFHILLSYILRA